METRIIRLQVKERQENGLLKCEVVVDGKPVEYFVHERYTEPEPTDSQGYPCLPQSTTT